MDTEEKLGRCKLGGFYATSEQEHEKRRDSLFTTDNMGKAYLVSAKHHKLFGVFKDRHDKRCAQCAEVVK